MNPRDIEIGSYVAGFRIERQLGAGGMGTVYLARHPRLPRSVAIKIVAAGVDSSVRARFEREADLVARLDHPNVVEVYDRGADGDLLWIAMRFVDGVDLSTMVAPGYPMRPPQRAVEIIRQAAAGLDAAHRRGLLHRDVKPANLLLTMADDGSDQVFVTDFGIARSLVGPQVTSTGSIVATIAYASPEQIGAGAIDHRTDVYSLGVTLYQLLTGELPFVRPTALATLNAHLNEEPPRASHRNPDVPAALDDVIARAMAKQPEQRFDTCGALAAAAAAAVAPSAPSLPSTVVRPVWSGSAPTAPAPERAVRSSRRRGALIAGGAALILGVVAVAATVVLGSARSDSTDSPVTTAAAGVTAGIDGPTSTAVVPTTAGVSTSVGTSDAVTPSVTTRADGAASATAQFPEWGTDAELVALFPDLLPSSPDGVGYGGARCESMGVVTNNGGMPAISCESDGIDWSVWMFRSYDPRFDETFRTNIDNDTSVEETWQRDSGSGVVRTTDGWGPSGGVLTVKFDDPARQWVVIDAGSWNLSGRQLYDGWWADAPI